MSLLSELDIQNSGDLMNYNTGTLFDLATGRYVPGVDGNMYINGGYAPHINSIVGPNGAFKSTMANALLMRSLGIYGDAEAIIEDTENSLDKDKPRATGMAEDLYDATIENRIVWLKGIDYNLDDLHQLIKKVCNKKEANRKEYIVDTPFFDNLTGKALKMWKPTYVFIDSLTELTAATEEDMLESEKSKSISEANTLMMADGNKKTVFIHTMRRLCQKYGIVLICTGHFDKVMQIDMYNPTPKDTTFSPKDWKTKGCGSKLKFLASIYARTQAALLLDSSKEPLYACGNGPSKDVLEISLTLERCKTANAGEMLPFVATQSLGLLNTVTNYHYLRLHDYFGLNGNKMKQQPFLIPDLTISRNTIRELGESNYQLRRALEIAAQYCYIRNNWNTQDYPVRFDMEPQKIFDTLNSDKNKNVISDILNSRGYWTYTKNEHPYMDLFRVLELSGATKVA